MVSLIIKYTFLTGYLRTYLEHLESQDSLEHLESTEHLEHLEQLVQTLLENIIQIGM